MIFWNEDGLKKMLNQSKKDLRSVMYEINIIIEDARDTQSKIMTRSDYEYLRESRTDLESLKNKRLYLIRRIKDIQNALGPDENNL